MQNWIDQHDVHAPFVVGHSLGGYVALAMAQLEPRKISGICLFHSTPYPDSEERKSNRNRVMEFVKVNGVGPFVDTFVPGLFFDKKHASIPYVDRMARKTPTETLLAYTVAMRDRLGSVDFLKGFHKPTLVLAGDKDTIVPLESLRGIARLAGNCTVQVLQDTGHMAMFEQPEKARRIVKDFIRG
jgi:pimeloyl-ACP methyl ester carboxylesterase